MEFAPAKPVSLDQPPIITHVIEKRKKPRIQNLQANPWKMYFRERRSRERILLKLDLARSALAESTRELEQYRTMAYRDGLTLLYNQRFVDEKLRKALRADSEKTSITRYVCMIVADINFLKFFNDTFGHDIGNEMIKLFAKKLKELSGDWEVAARTGFGDEFLLVSIRHNWEDIIAFCQNVQLQLSNIPFEAETGKTYAISASVGFAYSKLDPSFSYNKTFSEADQAMYLRKRNRVLPAWIPEGVVSR